MSSASIAAEKRAKRSWQEALEKRKEAGRRMTFFNFLIYSIFSSGYLLAFAYIYKEHRHSIYEFRMHWAFLCFLVCCCLDIIACTMGVVSVWNEVHDGYLGFSTCLLFFDTLLNVFVCFALPDDSAKNIGQDYYPKGCYIQMGPKHVYTDQSKRCEELRLLASTIWITLLLLIMRTFCMIHTRYTASLAKYGACYPVHSPHQDKVVIIPVTAVAYMDPLDRSKKMPFYKQPYFVNYQFTSPWPDVQRARAHYVIMENDSDNNIGEGGKLRPKGTADNANKNLGVAKNERETGILNKKKDHEEIESDSLTTKDIANIHKPNNKVETEISPVEFSGPQEQFQFNKSKRRRHLRQDIIK